MKKIGIITIVDYNNYGNRLQNYAMQEILKRRGFKVETVRNIPPNVYSNKTFFQIMKLKIKYAFKKVLKLPFQKSSNEREKNFYQFTTNHIKETEYVVTENNKHISRMQEFDGLVIGSDQIWNPNFRRFFFLDVAEGIGTPSITVAASFGVSQLDCDSKKFYKEGLKNLKEISVREFEGKDLVKNLCNIDVPVILDPTFILSKEEWLQISSPHELKPDEPYILIYSLGGLSRQAKKFLKQINFNGFYKVVDIGTLRNISYYSVGPKEFLDYINDASLLLTDSFHGIVFSLKFKTPFVVFDRQDFTDKKSMNSRIDTLFNHFDLTSRHINNIDIEDAFKMDFSLLEEKIEMKIREFDLFLDKGVSHFESK